jgi:glycosyltransferase involved in cell wall biosynthesis
MRRPWLSIVMPTFNGERYLPRALASIAEQELDGIEIIAVEDGSSDSTPAIIEAFAGRLPLRIVPGPRRGNWAAATNVGLNAARGEFACTLHQDDGYLPGRLAAVKVLVARHASAALWLHPARFYDARGRDVGPWRCPLGQGGGELSSRFVLERLLVQNFVAMPGPTFRRDDAVSVGGLDEALWYTADWDFWLKLATRGPVVYSTRELAFFRVHEASQTMQRTRDSDAFRAQLTTTFERHFGALAGSPNAHAVERAARLSIEVNVALAFMGRGPRASLRALRGALRTLDVDVAYRYGRDSRLHERVGARLRARLAPSTAAD